MAKHKTNVQFVKELMEVSKHGALAQVFVVDAIAKWADIIAKADPKTFENSFMSGDAWVGVAKEIQEKFKAYHHYSPKSN